PLSSLFLTVCVSLLPSFFLLTSPAPTALYTLSLHDALPISTGDSLAAAQQGKWSKHASYESFSESSNHRSSSCSTSVFTSRNLSDRKSTRLNSSHVSISYAVFCLKKKKQTQELTHHTHLRKI